MWVLKREPGGLPEYATLDKDFTIGNSLIAWSSDKDISLGFANERSAQDFMRRFHHYFDRATQVVELK